MHNLVSMHNQVQFGAIWGIAGLMIVAALMALAIFVFVKLVDRLGVLKTLAWCLGVFFLGIVGLSLMMFMGRAKVVAKHKQLASEVTSFVSAEARDVGPGSLPDYPRLVAPNSASAISVRDEQPATSAWDENVAPVANVYPGIADCGRPLAAKLVKHLQSENDSKNDEPKAEVEAGTKYRVALKNSGLDQPDYLNFLIRFREEFNSSFPGSFVDDMTAGSYPTPKDPEKEKQYQRLPVTVYSLSDGQGNIAKWFDDDQNRFKAPFERSGQMVCRLRRNGKLGQVEFVSDFIEKPWVADAEKFVSQHPKREFIIGFSPRLAKSEQEARVSALEDANARLGKSRNKVFSSNYDKEKNVVDRFVQKLTMPYGSVWREAVLIDYGMKGTEFWRFYRSGSATAEALIVNDGHPIANPPIANPPIDNPPVDVRVGRSMSRFDRTLSSPESMVAGLIMLTIVIGWVCNSLTQGYYRKPVWTVTGTVFSLGFIFLLLIVVLNFA